MGCLLRPDRWRGLSTGNCMNKATTRDSKSGIFLSPGTAISTTSLICLLFAMRLMAYQRHSWRQPAWSVLFLCILFISCFGQSPRARPPEKVQDTGAEKATEVEYQRLDIRPNFCSKGKRHIIENENALQALVSDCGESDINLPKIDFSKHTLIAMFARTDLCQKLELKIIRDDAGKRYRHIVTADRPTMCRGMGYVPFWVLVWKLPPGYEVTFEQIEPRREGKW